MPDTPPAAIDENDLALFNLLKSRPDGNGGYIPPADIPVPKGTLTGLIGGLSTAAGNAVGVGQRYLHPGASPSSAMVAPNMEPTLSDKFASLYNSNEKTLAELNAGLQGQIKAAQPVVSQADQQAQFFNKQSDEAKAIYDWYTKHPVPEPDKVAYSDTPELNLPPPPKAVPNEVNPVAQFAAAVAGLFDRHAAGEFNAAALDGAITHAKQLTQQNNQRYQSEVERLTAIHRSVQETADRKLRVDVLNTEARNKRTLEEHNQGMEAASEQAKAAMLHGEASVIADAEKANKPSREAAALLEATQQHIKDISKDQEHLMTLRTQLEDTAVKAEGQKQIHEDAVAAQAYQKEQDRIARHNEDVLKAKAASERQAASIKSREKIAADHDAIMREANKIRRDYNAKGGRAGSMVHDDGVTKSTWLGLQTAERSYQAAKRAAKEPSTSELSIPQADRDENLLQAAADVKAASDRFLEADANNRARGGAPKPSGGGKFKFVPGQGLVPAG